MTPIIRDKHPDETVSFYLNAMKQLNGRTLDGASATVATGDAALIVEDVAIDGNEIRVQFSGGNLPQMYNVEVQLTFSDDTDQPIFEFYVRMIDES